MKKIAKLGLVLGLSFTCMISSLNAATKDYLNADLSELKVDEKVKIVGLGEATHGNAEFQSLKQEVFEALVKNNGCQIFAIEGDFGGALKVNEYIQVGKGTAAEAVAEMDFAIYRTKQMEELVSWMRKYNETATKKLKFYGFDMQRFNNSKEILLSYIKKVDQTNLKDYEVALKDLKDRMTLEASKLKSIEQSLQGLLKKMDTSKEKYVSLSSETEFDIARQCMVCLTQNIVLEQSGINSVNTRDIYMKSNIDWLVNYEKGQCIFINGHNGHITKSNEGLSYTTMGSLLAQTYGEDYYALGTDFNKGECLIANSQGERNKVAFEMGSVLTNLTEELPENIYFLDFNQAQKDEKVKEVLSQKQQMASLGDGFDAWQKIFKTSYTVSQTPLKAYDSMILVKQVTPTEVKPLQTR